MTATPVPRLTLTPAPAEGLGEGTHPRTINRYSRAFADLSAKYSGQPLDVSFRELVGPLPADELTHGIYPYPARLLRHIPRFVLGTEQIIQGIDWVVDPFCGSGTILLEARHREVDSVGFDQNPIATLVSRVKTTSRSPDKLIRALDDVIQSAKNRRSKASYPQFLDKWYDAAAASTLSRLLLAKIELGTDYTSDYLALCVALLSRQLSSADPRIPVPVRTKYPKQGRHEPVDPWTAIRKIGNVLATRIGRLPRTASKTRVITADARNPTAWRSLTPHGNGVLLTSPPYGAAQKYIRSTSLEAGWLGYAGNKGTIELERSSIGREHLGRGDFSAIVDSINRTELSADIERDLEIVHQVNPLRSAIYRTYFEDMTAVIENAKITPQIKSAVLIVGDNIVAGHTVETSNHLFQMLNDAGFKSILTLRDPIRGRALLTKRNQYGKPAEAEYIQVFKR